MNTGCTNGSHNARRHATASHRQPNAVQFFGLIHQLQTERALSCNHVIVIVWRNAGRTGVGQHFLELRLSINERWPALHDLAAVPFYVGAFDRRRRLGHDDPRRRTHLARRVRECGAVIAGRMRSYAQTALGGRQPEHRVGRAAYLERAGFLQVFALEEQFGAG